MFQGRDVVIAIDWTPSVGLNNEGRLRLRQIIEDSLQPGDVVYVVPFATTVNPLQPEINPVSETTGIPFYGKAEDIKRILDGVPWQTNTAQHHVDIQKAESVIYKQLAQLNQCRLNQNQAVKVQSVVWVTDAPLLTPPGITSEVWKETPAGSPFRKQNSNESLVRQQWLEALTPELRQQQIDNYKLSIVDIPATVQEYCTPAPGGENLCLVNSYLFNQLWLSTLFSLLSLFGVTLLGVWGYRYWRSLQRVWQLEISCDDSEPQVQYLGQQQQLGLGTAIECPDNEFRGYLKRVRNQLFLEPTNTEELPTYYQGRHITQRQLLTGNFISLKCPLRSQREFELTIQIYPRY